MAPRAYSMERRAEGLATTRERVLDAAMAAYRERGIRATSMQDVARRADLAPGTVLNHFATPDELMSAVLDRITASLEIPDERIFRGIRSRTGRIRRLVVELFALYDRSSAWYEVVRGESAAVPALAEGEQRFWTSIEVRYVEALGPLTDDPLIRGTVHGLTNPATLGALREAGLSLEQASDVVGDLLAGVVGRARKGHRPDRTGAAKKEERS